MVRLAVPSDAQALSRLNDDFNGAGETTVDHIRRSLLENAQEIVVVAEENGMLAGFVCVQIKRSFCYTSVTPEITEVYVDPAFRRRGYAGEMIRFAQRYCAEHFAVDRFELLTGKDNFSAQALYTQLGYTDDGEMHLAKEV